MNPHKFLEKLQKYPARVVNDLLRGALDLGLFSRLSSYQFLCGVMPASCLLTHQAKDDSPACVALDEGLAQWFAQQKGATRIGAKRLRAYSSMVSEALQWLNYFNLPKSLELLKTDRDTWLTWLSLLTFSDDADPVYDYWTAMASNQKDSAFESCWNAFLIDDTYSERYKILARHALMLIPKY